MSAVSLEHATPERATMQAVRPRSGATPLLFFSSFLLLPSKRRGKTLAGDEAALLRGTCSDWASSRRRVPKWGNDAQAVRVSQVR